MTIQEAIRSHKEFRRAGDSLWWPPVMPEDFSWTLWSYSDVFARGVLVEDILATDWEIKE